MVTRLPFALFVVGLSAAFVAVAACQTDNSMNAANDGGGADSTAETSGSSSGAGKTEGGGGKPDAISDAKAEAGLGLLVDNMTSTKGTSLSLMVPDGSIPGSYYTYSDYPISTSSGMMSSVIAGSQLIDTAVSPAVSNADGSQIVGEICFGGGLYGDQPGTVVNYAGLGMNLMYGAPIDANSEASCPPPGLSPPVLFDASNYSGVSFYIWVDPSVPNPPAIHFGIPDIQTADYCSIPAVACAQADAMGGGDSAASRCFDDFGSDVIFTPGTWTRVAFTWAQLSQIGFGATFTALRTDALVGMKWQANGAGPDAAIESFRFCISDIYFTP